MTTLLAPLRDLRKVPLSTTAGHRLQKLLMRAIILFAKTAKAWQKKGNPRKKQDSAFPQR